MADPIIIDDNGGAVAPSLRVVDTKKMRDLHGLKTRRAEIPEKLARLVVFTGDYPLPTILHQVDGNDLLSFALEAEGLANVRGKYDGSAGSERLILLTSDPMDQDTLDPYSYYVNVKAKITYATIHYRSMALRVDFDGNVKIALEFQ